MTPEPVDVTVAFYITASRTGVILAVTPTAAQYLGYDPSQLLGQSLLQLLPVGDRPHLSQSLRSLGFEPVHQTLHLVQRDGNPLAVDVTLQLMQGEGAMEPVLLTVIPERSPTHPRQVVVENSSSFHQRLIAQIAADFSRQIRPNLNLEDILVTAVNQIQTILDVDRVLVYRTYSEFSPKPAPLPISAFCTSCLKSMSFRPNAWICISTDYFRLWIGWMGSWPIAPNAF